MSHSNLPETHILATCKAYWGSYHLKISDIYYEGPLGSRKDTLILNLKSGTVHTGCFTGTIERFEKQMEADYAYKRIIRGGEEEYVITLRDGYRGAITRFKAIRDAAKSAKEIKVEEVKVEEEVELIGYFSEPYGRKTKVADWPADKLPLYYRESGLGSQNADVYIQLDIDRVSRGCYNGTLEQFIKQVEFSYATGRHSQGMLTTGRFLPEYLEGYRKAFPRFKKALEFYQQRKAELNI